MGAIETLAGHPLAAAAGWGILHSLWQVSAIALGCALALRLARRAAPDVRYAISVAGLALMVAWPAATAVEHAGPAGTQPGTTRQSADTAPDAIATAAFAPQIEATASAVPPPVALRGAPQLERIVPYASLLWAAGVLLCAARALGGWYVALRIRSRYVAPPPDAWQGRFARLARRLKVRDRVTLLESTLVDVPTVLGWIKPVVLVPASAFAGLAPQQLEAILAHELAHVRRHDYLVNILQTVVETLLFYHPATWWLSREARAEREHCCDDLAVSLCGDRVEYARALAELESVRRTTPALALGAAGGSLLHRIARVLGASASHEPRTPGWILAVAVAVGALAIALPAGPLRAERSTDAAAPNTIVIDQAPPAPAKPPLPAEPATTPTAPRVAPAAPSSPAPPQSPAAPAAPAAPDSRSLMTLNGEGRMSHSSSDGKWEIRYKGAIELSDDGHDIQRVSPGGYFKVSEGGWFSRRSVAVTATASGVERRFYRGLSEKPFDADARAFLGDMLQKAMAGGFAAEQRVARLLERGGPDVVLKAIEGLQSDYARKIYYSQLFEQARLDPQTLARALGSAGRQISSDYEMADLLIAAAPQAFATAETRRTYFACAGTIDSDYERRRALGQALNVATLDAAAVADLLAAAMKIDSDYEAAELLIAVSRERPVDAATAPSFFRAADSISSDYEHRRVLSAVMEAREADPEVRRALLKSAASIGSDYERAEFLLQWLKQGGVSGIADDFLAVVSGISSGYERARVLEKVLDQPQLPPATLAAALRVVGTTSGQYEVSQLLQRAARRHAITGEVREAYLAAADRLHGYEKDEAYAALVKADRRTKS